MSEKRKDNPFFRKRLKELIKERDITQDQFALELTKLLGKEEEDSISRKTVSFWCNGKAYPTEENLTAICDFFNVRKSWLYGESKYRTDREEMIAKWDKKYSQEIDKDGLNFIQIIEDSSGKTLFFSDGEEIGKYLKECVESCITIAEKNGIGIEDRKQRKRKGVKTE